MNISNIAIITIYVVTCIGGILAVIELISLAIKDRSLYTLLLAVMATIVFVIGMIAVTQEIIG